MIWGDIATWVTGIASIALFVVAFLQIRNERDSRIRREYDLAIQTKRSQAELISSWIVKDGFDEGGNPCQWIAVLNQSSQPIYQIIVSVMALGNLGQPRGGPVSDQQVLIDIAPPGRGYIAVNEFQAGMMRRPGVEIAFQDAVGNNWVRKAMGELIEIDTSTVEYYEIQDSLSWHRLSPDLPPDEIMEAS